MRVYPRQLVFLRKEQATVKMFKAPSSVKTMNVAGDAYLQLSKGQSASGLREEVLAVRLNDFFYCF